MNTGRWPEPPPVAMPTLSATGASARTMARGDGRRSWSGCAARMPSSISSTNGSGSFRIFCIGSLPRGRRIGSRVGRPVGPNGLAATGAGPGHRRVDDAALVDRSSAEDGTQLPQDAGRRAPHRGAVAELVEGVGDLPDAPLTHVELDRGDR